MFLFFLASVIVFAVFFYRAAEFGDRSGALWAGLSVAASLAGAMLSGWMLGYDMCGVLLFNGLLFVVMGLSSQRGPGTALLRQQFSRRARRLRRNQCPGCGYDLTGTKRPGFCPECGEELPAPEGAEQVEEPGGHWRW